MEGLKRAVVLACTITTLFLLGGIGVSAASGQLGSARAGHELVSLPQQLTAAQHKCNGDKEHHKHHKATPGHKHGCDDDGGGSGGGGDD